MFIVTLNGIVHSEAADVIRATQIAEEAVAAGVLVGSAIIGLFILLILMVGGGS